jgi:hypothetical protein
MRMLERSADGYGYVMTARIGSEMKNKINLNGVHE